jgi:hypothetical protein
VFSVTIDVMLSVIFFLNLLLLFGVTNSSFSESKATCVAIDFSADGYVCTDNPVDTRRAASGDLFSSFDDLDLGVSQRLSGSAGELLLYPVSSSNYPLSYF